jgi:4a-hydroxytetrahydrobiopterin dehydratase
MKNLTPEDLARKPCTPCEGKTAPMARRDAEAHLKAVPGWALREEAKSIGRTYTMKNFMAAIQFIERIAALAEAENHHPDLHLTGYRLLDVELSTHAIGGLSENDFILAAKIEKLDKSLKEK